MLSPTVHTYDRLRFHLMIKHAEDDTPVVGLSQRSAWELVNKINNYGQNQQSCCSLWPSHDRKTWAGPKQTASVAAGSSSSSTPSGRAPAANATRLTVNLLNGSSRPQRRPSALTSLHTHSTHTLLSVCEGGRAENTIRDNNGRWTSSDKVRTHNRFQLLSQYIIKIIIILAKSYKTTIRNVLLVSASYIHDLLSSQ